MKPSGRYGNRPAAISTMQIQSKSARFIDPRNMDDVRKQTAASSRAAATSEETKKEYQTDEKMRTLDPNFKYSENIEVNAKKSTLDGTFNSQGVRGLLSQNSETMKNIPVESFGPSKRSSTQTTKAYLSNQNNDLIGGIDADDRYRTTTQALNEGDDLENKLSSRKKNLQNFEPSRDMISPITNEPIADYGNWKEQLKEKKKASKNLFVNKEDDDDEDDPIMSKLRKHLKMRGAKGIVGLGRVFKIMDDDGSKTLNFAEFKKAMKEMRMSLNDSELILLFKRFDMSKLGVISYDDFLRVVTGKLNKRRKVLVNMAYDVLDKDGNGIVDLSDICMAYNVTAHPEFKSGKRTKEDILREFLDGFDVGGEKDGKVTRKEFENYYSNISASIDRDDTFELMIRNAWHISGGEGAAANSANIRVLVTHPDGTTTVEEVKNDLGISGTKKERIQQLTKRLQEQGINATSIKTAEDTSVEEQKNNFGGSQAKAFHANKIRERMQKNGVNSANRYDDEADDDVPSHGDRFAPPPVPSRSKSRPRTASKKSGKASKETAVDAGVSYLITKIKQELQKRGAHGIIGLQRRFKIMDDDGSKTLDMNEFKKAMKEMNFDCSDSDLRMLFNAFDADSNGHIDFEELLQGLRDPMNDERKALVKMAFSVIDRDGSGVVDIEEIVECYDASQHPEVKSRSKTVEQVLQEFLDTFDVGGNKDGQVTLEEFTNYYHNISSSIDNDAYFELMIRNAWHLAGGSGSSANTANLRVMVTTSTGKEKVITLNNDLGLKEGDLNGLYQRLKAQGVKDIKKINGKKLVISIVNGKEVVKQDTKESGQNLGEEVAKFRIDGNATKTWKRNQKGTNKIEQKCLYSNGKNLADSIVNQMQKREEEKKELESAEIKAKTLLDVLKVQLLSKGPGGIIALQRKFVEMDTDGNKTLDKEEFKNTVKALDIPFSEDQLSSVFSYFDSDKSGTIDYSELLKGLRGHLSPKNLVLAHQAFDSLDKGKTNVIDPQDLISNFNASKHPDVLQGFRTESEVLQEFLDTFDVGSTVPGKVVRDEFIEYYTNINAVLEEEYLEMILRKTWGVNPPSDYKAKQITNSPGKDTKAATRLRTAQEYSKQNAPEPAKIESNSPRVAIATTQNNQEANILEIQTEIQKLRLEAIKLYNKSEFIDAIEKFQEVLLVLQIIYPENHPECVKVEKSIVAIQRKLGI